MPQLHAFSRGPGSAYRQNSHLTAFISGRSHLLLCRSAPAKPAVFDSTKLSVTFLGLAEQGPALPAPRRYTLTHSDFSGRLFLSIGQCFDEDRLSNWYLKLIRDEVLAEWIVDSDDVPQLHIFCHISSERRWSSPVPPAMRSRVFQHEMPLVLQAIRYGDQTYLQDCPQLLKAKVVLHLASHLQALNMKLEWGIFGEESTWKQPALSWLVLWWKNVLQNITWVLPVKEKSASQVLLDEAIAAQATFSERSISRMPENRHPLDRRKKY